MLPCHAYGNCAPQQRRYTMTGVGKYQPMSEDCLTLNVVTPRWSGPAPDGEALPVMFFIHGGGYILGSSATPIYDGAASGPARLRLRVGELPARRAGMPGSVVAVHHGHHHRMQPVPAGLVAALRWVRENIAAFGGDPEKVTIFGESAGAHAVATLLAVPDVERPFRPGDLGESGVRDGRLS